MMTSEAPREDRIQDGQEGGLGAKLDEHTPLQQYFYSRLVRLMRLRQYCSAHGGYDDWLMRALDKSIYSVLCDCIAQGLGDEARSVLREPPPVN